jgi:hypothetical protein
MERLTISLSRDELIQLQEIARNQGLSLSAYCRYRLFGQTNENKQETVKKVTSLYLAGKSLNIMESHALIEDENTVRYVWRGKTFFYYQPFVFIKILNTHILRPYAFVKGSSEDERKANLFTLLTKDKKEFNPAELATLKELGLLQNETEGYSVPMKGHYVTSIGKLWKSNRYDKDYLQQQYDDVIAMMD